MPSHGMPREEIRPLTGIRGVAAIWVLLLHYCQELRALVPAYERLEWLYGRGHLGVDLFFVLSGFIIAYVYGAERFRLEGPGWLKFLWYRFARLYPNHLATLGALVAMVLGAGLLGVRVTGDYPWSYLPAQLLMLHALPGMEQGTWNYPSWSISSEWFAYVAIFPLVVLASRRPFVRRHGWIFCYAALGIYLGLWNAGVLGGWTRLVMVSCEFMAGGMLYHVFKADSVSRVRASAFLPWLCGLILVLLLAVPAVEGTLGDRLARSLVVLACPVLILGLTREDNLVSRLLCRRIAIWLGLISYALYMVHAVVEKALKVLLPADAFAASGLAVRLAVAAVHLTLPILAAALLYRLVELPSRDVLRRVWERMLRRLDRRDRLRPPGPAQT